MNPHDALIVIARRHEARPGDLSATVVVLAIVGIVMYAVWYFSAAQVAKRRLRATGVWTVKEMPEDALGKIVGRARAVDPHKTLIAPISGLPCVAYKLQITERHGKHTRTLLEDSASIPFYVEDETGRALIEPAGEMLLMELESIGRPSNSTPTPAQQRMLRRHATAKTWEKLRLDATAWREQRIDVGEIVAVLGTAIREPDPDGQASAEYRGLAPTRLRMNGTRQDPLIVSDDPTTTR